MTDKHTPGPWMCDEAGLYSESGNNIATIGQKCSDADLRLIAAAPDMLAVLQTLTREGVSLELYAAARAAIDKATNS